MADAVPRVAVLTVAAAAAAWAAGAIAGVDPDAPLPTSYAAALPAARVADAVAGVAMIVAGALACTQPRVRRLGLLVLLAGFAWFGPDWEGAAAAPAWLRSLGAVVAPFSLALVVHLGLSLPRGRIASRAARAAVAAAYAVAAVVSVGRALVRDPLLDLYCWRNCSDNVFLVHADPGVASALGDLRLWSVLVIGLGLAAVVARRLGSASEAARRVEAPLLVPVALVGVAEGVAALALLHTPLEDPARASFAAIFLARSFAFAALSIGLAWSVVRVARTRARIVRLSNELGEAPAPGTLRATLAAALADPRIEVLYPRAQGGLIDAEGLPAAAPGGGRAVAHITRRDRELALVLYDPALGDERELERALGSAARLALENEALRAEALAQLHDLRRSRARIVEAGDAERRRLERDLHDGAQQHLLALSYDLRLAQARAAHERDDALVARLGAAGGEAGAALEELRVIAHGIHPAILSEAGLAAALETLADEAPVAVELGEIEPHRQPPPVETTVFIAAGEAVEDAHRRGASFVAIAVVRDGGRVVVTADDDGAPRRSELEHLADRVGALGGTLAAGDRTLRAEIPCA